MRRASALLVLLLPGVALGDPQRLRLSTPAPEGTAYARELHSFSREVRTGTGGQLDAKWYMGAITGDELAQVEHMQKGQLDGAGLAVGCEKVAPVLHVLRVVGLIQSRDEAIHVMRLLQRRIDQDMARSGFVGLGLGTLGSQVILSRTPVRSLAELKKQRLWVWDKDEVQVQLLRSMGLRPVPLPLEAAGPAYDQGQIDGFLAVPGAALAFQWSTRARYFLDFPVGQIAACFVMSQRSLDALPVDQRKVVAAAAAKLSARVEEVGRELDAALLGGLFEKQGLQRVPAERTLVADFLDEARRAREQMDEKQVPRELMRTVLNWLADYRAEHQQPAH
jgi:TRAP-type C4-dicarboxylate transport system substrate-binding protein